MRFARTAVLGVSKRNAAMQKARCILLHTLAAAGFIFLLQRYTLGATLEFSLPWALAFGGCAAGLAYMQSNR